VTATEVGFLEPHSVDLNRAARAMLPFGRGGYVGARGDDRALQEWFPGLGSADSHLLPDRLALIARSNDLDRNDPLSAGAFSTIVTNTVGWGLTPRPQIDRMVLGISEEEAKAFQTSALRLWFAWSETTQCDLTRRHDFPAMSRMVLRNTLAEGDVFALRRFRPSPDSVLGLRVQLVEGPRICNPNQMPDTQDFAGGIEYGPDGEMRAVHVRSRYPGDFYGPGLPTDQWSRVQVTGSRSGEPQVLQIYDPKRVNTSRGEPILAPVIKALKQMSRLSDAELMASVLNAFFTVFIKQDASLDMLPGLTPPLDNDVRHFGPAIPNQPQFKLGQGTILGLAAGEDVSFADPKRPNQSFEPFWLAFVKQIGAAIEMPFELMIKHFSASYSASRAALLEFWRTVKTRRQWLVSRWCQPCYEWVLTEAIARGLLDAPGYFENPLLRRAWSFCAWSGPAQGQIDPRSEGEAAAQRITDNLSNYQRETAELTGEDWEAVIEQKARERKMMETLGLLPSAGDVVTEDPAERRARLAEAAT